jgi:tartrate dehydrogenase/decarboxylase/D-malate dehydrogenase
MTVTTHEIRLAAIPGDGIGREVTPLGIALLEVALAPDGIRLVVDELDWGSERYVAEGSMMPADGLDRLRRADAIFLGAVGDPRIVPDHVSLWGLLIAIRRGLGQSINLRPARFIEGMRSPLARPEAFDLVVVRENSEGEYSSIGGVTGEGPDEMALGVSVFTRPAIEAAARFAFELASRRRRSLTSATKSNGIVHTMPFWDRVVRDVAAEHAEVAFRSIHLDALLALLVRQPESFDVIVASNLFGDLLTDLVGALMGSIGVAPSANIDPTRRNPSMFEPVHGSAPDIAGQGIANPIGQAWSGVLLLEHLGFGAAAQRLFDAIAATIKAGDVTRDMGGNLGTAEVGRRIERRLG